jgi:hypothetical protein
MNETSRMVTYLENEKKFVRQVKAMNEIGKKMKLIEVENHYFLMVPIMSENLKNENLNECELLK